MSPYLTRNPDAARARLIAHLRPRLGAAALAERGIALEAVPTRDLVACLGRSQAEGLARLAAPAPQLARAA